MKRIALFGGAFDPPHFGHMLTITTLLNSNMVDEVWAVPVGDDRLDKKVHSSAVLRKEMVELALKEFFSNREDVKLITLQLDGTLPGSYTIDLMDELKKNHPGLSFYFVIGSDNLASITQWKEPDRLQQEVHWLVMQRLGVSAPEKLPTKMSWLKNEYRVESSIASSLVREMAKKGKELSGIVPTSVLKVINREGLYK